MGYRNKTYIIFDGDNDIWAYRFMKGWRANKNIDFNFHDAHDINRLTNNARSPEYVKKKLKERFKSAKQIIVLIGDKTKNLYRYVRWELEVAQTLDLPIIAVNLNNLRSQDIERVPPIIRDKYVVHIPFKLAIIKFALDNFPNEYHRRQSVDIGSRYYSDDIYQKLGI
ncbi:TIR domain-containing protein [Zunongwangia profunda]|jgi:hypothetical protein|uniref:TIR domain-containing protein n=1 Tax=Zunongwangia profunda TaxID=398743 RepID=UPI001D197960|nr:TIR domain-containing protein [Zunongwangia profunda]MCC4228616.1 TIR domain-containing protein [Zunongwangia profunda]|tara:strand:- start:3907 stop:4410 length:504 start_codon:yes stop_codon:yes gene_type:complete